MSLYDDLDSKQPSEQIDGWSSGIKLLQQQLVAKKASSKNVPRKSFNPTGGGVGGRSEDSVIYRTMDYPKPISSPLFAGTK